MKPSVFVLPVLLAAAAFNACNHAQSECALADLDPACNLLLRDFLYDIDSTASAASVQFVGAGQGQAVYSLDGINWTSVPIGSTSQYTFNTVVYSGSNYVIGGQDTTTSMEAVYYSADGINWTQATTPNCGATASIYDIASSGARLVAVGVYGGTNACVHYSTDHGVTWTQGSATAGPALSLTQVETNGTNFYTATAVGGGDVRVLMSTDGLDFSSEPDIEPMDPTSFASSNALAARMRAVPGTGQVYLIGGEETGPTNALSTVLDGSNFWQPGSPKIFNTNTTVEYPRGIAYDGANLVAVGDACRLDVTTNLTAPAWLGADNYITGCSGLNLYDLLFVNGTFVAAAQDGSSNTYFGYSPNGYDNWTFTLLDDGSAGPAVEIATNQ